jgi:hypothetical protein
VNRSTAANQALDVARSYADAKDPILLPDEGAYHQDLTARGVQLLVPPVWQPVRLVVAVRRSRRQRVHARAWQLLAFDDAGGALEGSNPTLVEGRSDERAGIQDPGGEGAGMDTVASSAGTAIVGDRSGEGPLVILVGGALHRRVIGAATAQLAGPVMVLVLGGWPVRVLPAGGPLPTRLVDEPGLAVDGGRPLLPEGHPAGRAGPGSAGRRRDAAEDAGPSAVGLPAEAAAPTVSRNLFRREGEYWTVGYEGAVVRLRDAKGLRHLARLLAQPGREFHVVELEAAHRRPAVAAVGPPGRAGAGELQVRPDLVDAGPLLDATAKAAYQARLTELGAELEEAEGGNDPARATRARAERDFLVAELARAVGLGAGTAGRPPMPSGPG